MTSSRFVVLDNAESLATRESGAAARAAVVKQLRAFDVVVVDFANAQPTPSFADEFLGRLAESLGRAEFKARVQVVNVSEGTRPLLRQVLLRRLKSEVRIAESA